MSEKPKLTPMMEQYFSIKNLYQDAFLFYRLGDFYELFYDDAIQASKILEITLTSRNKNAEDPIPMCGVPYHSANDYIRRLIESGHKVAMCEQMEDPKQSKGMVKREVVRVITPGTIMQDEALSVKENNYLASILFHESCFLLVYIDLTTGEIYLTQSNNTNQFISELQSLEISEIIVDADINQAVFDELKEKVASIFTKYQRTNHNTKVWDLDNPTLNEEKVLDLLFDYLNSLQFSQLDHIKSVQRYKLSQYLQMNHYAKQQLELTRSLRTQSKKGSLLSMLDKTKTAMGGRLLNHWLDKPLLDSNVLSQRHQKVQQFMSHYFERKDLVNALDKIYDLERLVSKISVGSANARDLDQLRNSLFQIPRINQILQTINSNATELEVIPFKLLHEFQDLLKHIDQILIDEPPISITEGGIINKGYNKELDKYRDALENGKSWLTELQAREREITGLKTLKVGYNKVFGYYIEVSRLQAQHLNDDRYIRKQTLTNSERYFTEELKEIETTILGAQDKSEILEYNIFIELRETVNQYIKELQKLASEISELDVLCNFADISEEEAYTRAIITHQPKEIELIDSRHPVVEKIIGEANFVANDLQTNSDKFLMLLTGPNMSGKSTYMRQIAYCVILNQIGCFVPAKYAKLPIIDKIFTRIGSADDISSGQSTFMVEMMETNIALEEATEHSLLLFDEIGRGTATFDGMALAEAILYYIANKVKALTIFSTHYHELTDLDKEIISLKNIHVGAQEHQGNLVFLHKIIDGPADKSYGIHVAKLAGLPQEVISNSQDILIELEANASNLRNKDFQQIDLFAELPDAKQSESNEIIEDLIDLDIYNMTPIQAMQKLNELHSKAQKYS